MIVLILLVFVPSIFIIFLIHKGRKKYSNKMLALYFLGQITYLFGYTFVFADANNIRFFCIFFPVLFTWGPSIYFYVSSLLNPAFRLKINHTLHFVPCVLVITNLLLNYFSISIHEKDFFTEITLSIKNNNRIFQYILNSQILIYNIICVLTLIRFLKKNKIETEINRYALRWIKFSVFGFFIACMISLFSYYFSQNSLFTSINWDFVCLFTFFIFFTLLFYFAISVPDLIINFSFNEKRTSVLPNAEKMFNNLERYMNEKQPFRNPTITLKELANESGMNERFLSNLLNEYKKQNFYDYVNSFRVKTAVALLSNPAENKRTMLDVLFDSGFNSKATFNRTFKKHTGYTPSDYRKRQNTTQIQEGFYERQVSINTIHKLSTTTS